MGMIVKTIATFVEEFHMKKYGIMYLDHLS